VKSAATAATAVEQKARRLLPRALLLIVKIQVLQHTSSGMRFVSGIFLDFSGVCHPLSYIALYSLTEIVFNSNVVLGTFAVVFWGDDLPRGVPDNVKKDNYTAYFLCWPGLYKCSMHEPPLWYHHCSAFLIRAVHENDCVN
jgi:hypothetical protein